MTIWSPDTCGCVIKYRGDFQNPTFLEQCKTHNTPAETLTHNQSFNLRSGRNPNNQESESIVNDKGLEKRKPEFKRR